MSTLEELQEETMKENLKAVFQQALDFEQAVSRMLFEKYRYPTRCLLLGLYFIVLNHVWNDKNCNINLDYWRQYLKEENLESEQVDKDGKPLDP